MQCTYFIESKAPQDKIPCRKDWFQMEIAIQYVIVFEKNYTLISLDKFIVCNM